DDGRRRRAAFDHRVGDAGGVQRDGAHRVIIAGDHVVDVVGRAVGVHHRDHRDAELLGFLDRDLFMADVDDEDDVRRRFHLLDAAEALLQLLHLAAHHRGFFLATLAERFVPTNSTLPPAATTPFTKFAASAYSGCVFSRLMVWIWFGSPQMS